MMIRKLPQAILFDLDDTIVALTSSGARCWQDLCHRYAARIDGVEPERLQSAIQAVAHWFWSDAERHRRGRLDLFGARREIVGRAFRDLGIANTDMADELADAFTVEREAAIELFPGALTVLRALRDRVSRLALVTNGDATFQRAKVARFQLESLFDHIQIEGEFGVGKPDDRVYHHVLGRLAVEPCDAWMVGDNLEWDVAAPQRIGIRGIWIDADGTGLPPDATVRPDLIIRTLAELLPPPHQGGGEGEVV